MDSSLTLPNSRVADIGVAVVGPKEILKRACEHPSLSNFIYKRLLWNNWETKTAFIEGEFQNQLGSAILILEKESFTESTLKDLLKEENSQQNILENDIYFTFRLVPKPEFSGIKATVIYPATEKHFQKYEYQQRHIVEETYQSYELVTLPFLKGEQLSLEWVYNILEHKSEADRIIYEDPDPETGFILLPDLKWDSTTIEALYILALPHKRGIHSLRDLNDQHLPLLRNIYDQGLVAIQRKYNVQKSQIRVYIHYQPTFYYLHIHFTHLQSSPQGSNCDRSHMITSVINNIELLPNYYQKATLPFIVQQKSGLFGKYKTLGMIKEDSREQNNDD